MKTKNTKIIIISALIISLLAIGIGFAAFSTILSIDGTASISSSSWNVYFSKIERDDANSTSGIGTTLPEIGDNENAGSNTIDTKIDSFDVTFTEPNQKVVYIATVTNGGTYNAKLTVKNVGTPSCSGTGDNAETDATNVCNNLTYTVTGPEVDSTLSAGSSATYTITIQYNDISDASLLPKASVSITIPSSTFTYTQVESISEINEDDSIISLEGYQWIGNDTMSFLGVKSYNINFETIDAYSGTKKSGSTIKFTYVNCGYTSIRQTCYLFGARNEGQDAFLIFDMGGAFNHILGGLYAAFMSDSTVIPTTTEDNNDQIAQNPVSPSTEKAQVPSLPPEPEPEPEPEPDSGSVYESLDLTGITITKIMEGDADGIVYFTGGGTDVDNQNFITWLQENGTITKTIK